MTDERRALLVDAFADEALAGNPAGVVPDAAGLDEATMRALARELGASETAFVRSADDPDADRRLRFFSPTAEVDLCGHATVATHAALLADGAIEPGEHAVETDAGTVGVTVAEDGTIWLRGEPATVEPVAIEYDRLGAALGIDPAALRDVGADLPVAVASTGLPFLVVPVNFLERLGEAAPDDDAVATLADEHDAAGVYAFTFDALGADATLHARCFAPGLGISEDPVTGTASGAAGAYLHAVDAFDDPAEEFRFEQGHLLDRPGTVRVRVERTADGADATDGIDASAVGTVRVGGRAAVALDGRVRLPATDRDGDDDGIVVA